MYTLNKNSKKINYVRVKNLSVLEGNIAFYWKLPKICILIFNNGARGWIIMSQPFKAER
jgi:hypothetical protein